MAAISFPVDMSLILLWARPDGMTARRGWACFRYSCPDVDIGAQRAEASSRVIVPFRTRRIRAWWQLHPTEPANSSKGISIYTIRLLCCDFKTPVGQRTTREANIIAARFLNTCPLFFFFVFFWYLLRPIVSHIFRRTGGRRRPFF